MVADIVAAVAVAADTGRMTVEAVVAVHCRGGLASLVVDLIAAAVEAGKIETGRHQRWRGVERYRAVAVVEACLVVEYTRVASAEGFVVGLY